MASSRSTIGLFALIGLVAFWEDRPSVTLVRWYRILETILRGVQRTISGELLVSRFTGAPGLRAKAHKLSLLADFCPRLAYI